MEHYLLLMLGGPPKDLRDRLNASLDWIKELPLEKREDLDVFITGYPGEVKFYRDNLEKFGIIPDKIFSRENPVNTYGNALDLLNFLKQTQKIYNNCYCLSSEIHLKRFDIAFNLLGLNRFFLGKGPLYTTAGNDGASEPIKLNYYHLFGVTFAQIFGKNIANNCFSLSRKICQFIRKIMFWKFK